MDVRIVRVLVRQDLMAMRMHMRFVATPGERVLVLVMFVVTVPVRVLEWLVRVLMQMPLAQVQPDP